MITTGLDLPAIVFTATCLIATYVGARVALEEAGARLARAKHRRQLRRAGQLLQRIRPHFEADGMTW